MESDTVDYAGSRYRLQEGFHIPLLMQGGQPSNRLGRVGPAVRAMESDIVDYAGSEYRLRLEEGFHVPLLMRGGQPSDRLGHIRPAIRAMESDTVDYAGGRYHLQEASRIPLTMQGGQPSDSLETLQLNGGLKPVIGKSQTATKLSPAMDPTTRRHQTANPYESQFGYSRAVRRGPFIFVSGTTAIDTTTGVVAHPESAYHQALKIFSEIVSAVEALGGTRSDVMRVRMFVTADEDSGDVGRALKEAFGEVGPAATMILGAKFVRPEMKVEIEADALVLWWV